VAGWSYNPSRMYDERDPRGSRRGRPVLAAFVTALLTSTGVFAALTVADGRGLLGFLHSHQQGDVEVPSLTGVTVEQARELLRPRELLLTLQAERADPVVSPGNIAGQVPLAGSRAARGTAVQAFVSSGAGATTVPNLVGYRPDDAVEQLRTLRLLPGRRQEEASDTVAAGLVIGTEPPTGRAVAPNAPVALIVSTGPTPRAVPKLLGLQLGKAKKLIADSGFKLGTTKIGSSDRYDDDTIIKQVPAEASLAPPGSLIDVVVND
jgi:eukaryotic-like serine/threonine-protein kinase